MKRLSHTIARFFSVAFVLLFSLFSSSQSARANTVDDVITSVNVYNQKGEELTDGRLKQVLARFKEKGMYFAVASGRGLLSLEKLFEEV